MVESDRLVDKQRLSIQYKTTLDMAEYYLIHPFERWITILSFDHLAFLCMKIVRFEIIVDRKQKINSKIYSKP